MSYNYQASRGIGRRIRAEEPKPKPKAKKKEDKKAKSTGMVRVNDRTETKRNNAPKKSKSRNGVVVKRLTKAQMDRLKEHSKLHKGGMGSKHMRKMIFVMTKEGRSFSEAHRIAVKHDKMKK